MVTWQNIERLNMKKKFAHQLNNVNLLEAISYIELDVVALNRPTLGSPLDNGLGPLALWIWGS